MKKISIIVPVYNVEKYLEKCLESLVKQTLKDIEIIVINDGSPDNSQKIIDKFKKNNAKVIPVVTFGNRNFDNSLFELISIMNARNFEVFAAAAFSCEHSFGHVLGEGRPDSDDLEEAYQFGKKMFEFRNRTDPFYVPGNLQDGYYKPQDRNGNFIDIRKVKPKTKDSCTGCKACIRNC